MSEVSNGDAFTRNPTPTIITGLTTTGEIFAGLIKDDVIREATVALIPLAVLGIVLILRNWKKEFEFKRGVKLYTDMIAELKSEANIRTTTKSRKSEIQIQIKKHQATLDTIRENNIKIIAG